MPYPTHEHVATVIPCTDKTSAAQFFTRLGFTPPTDEQKREHESYLMLSHPNGSAIHLRVIGPDEQGWLDPLKNSFGIYVYVKDVDALASEFTNEIIEPEKKATLKDHGMYEFSLNGPDGCLVRVGWPAKGWPADDKNTKD